MCRLLRLLGVLGVFGLVRSCSSEGNCNKVGSTNVCW